MQHFCDELIEVLVGLTQLDAGEQVFENVLVARHNIEDLFAALRHE